MTAAWIVAVIIVGLVLATYLLQGALLLLQFAVWALVMVIGVLGWMLALSVAAGMEASTRLKRLLKAYG